MTPTVLIAFFALVIGVPVVLASRGIIRRVLHGSRGSKRHRARHRGSAMPFLIVPFHAADEAGPELRPAWRLAVSPTASPSRTAPDLAEREVPVEQLPGFADVADVARDVGGIADRSRVARPRTTAASRRFSGDGASGQDLTPPVDPHVNAERAD